MFKFYLIFFFLILITNLNADNKNKIIENLKNTQNLDFKFEQNINGKTEIGICTIEYPKKYIVNMLKVIIKFWFQMENHW